MAPSSEDKSAMGVWRQGKPWRTGITIEGFPGEDRGSQDRYGMGRQRGHGWSSAFLVGGMHVEKGGTLALEGLEMLT